MAFIDYLVQKEVIKQADAGELLGKAEKAGVDVGDILVEGGMSKERLLDLKAEYLNIPSKSVDPKDVPVDILRYIPEESASHYQFIPIGLAEGVLEVGLVDPDNIEARDALQFIASRLGLPYKIFLISRADFETLLGNYKGLSGEVNKALSDLEGELNRGDDVSAAVRQARMGMERALKDKEPETRIVEDTPVMKIVAVILQHAVEGNASDIHIERMTDKVKVRFRVDGALYTSLFLPASVHETIVARIKVLSNLKLYEKRKPQDGSFSTNLENRKIDFRVSTFPAYYGEKVVIRVLDPGKGVKKLEETGLTEDNIKKIRAAIARPFGLLLLTGPTGSGKTTTLYAMLNELDREKNNVVSLEDPVEYIIDGVNQSQVKPEIEYTFASGLRNILRQDPNIIMVGEIRDKETAQLAIQAALTGHLVLSTLHTNNAAGVVPRLVDMGVDPYLIAPTLILAVAQRLVQVMCPSSKKPIPVEGGIRAMIEKQFEDLPASIKKNIKIPKEVYDAIPSPECPGGTRGRIGVFEILEVDREMERVILENPVEDALLKAARAKGMLSMKEDAMLKAFDGAIPFREVNKFE